MDAGVPIVPIVFLDALDASPKHGLVVRPTTVDVVVLPPIDVTRWDERELDANICEVRELFLKMLEQGGR